MTVTTRKRAAIPDRWQNVAEIFYDFVHGFVDETLGEKGKPFFPFVFSLFMIVLMGNMLGMIPYSFTYTSHIIVTGALALLVFFGVTIMGFVRHGVHFFSLFVPKGLPAPIVPLVAVIEVISYCSRPISLSVRLFINMMAGHTILKVVAGFSILMGAAFGILPMLFNVALIGLEVMIAFIQAYVFAILSCVYIKDAIELH
jgi:F-type H+-transporting ATPase subunit a